MTKDDIIECALEHFSQKGYPETYMSEIARDLKVKKASLYYHINNKQELLYEIIKRGLSKMLKKLEEIYNSENDPKTKLHNAITSHSTFIMDNKGLAKILFEDWRFLEPEHKLDVESHRVKYEWMFKELVREGISKGVFTSFDPSVLSSLLLGLSSWGYKWFKETGRFTSAEISATASEVLLSGILKK